MRAPRHLLLFVFLLFSACTPSEIFEDSLSQESLTIAYAEPISNYSPFTYTAINRQYLANLYEPLVRFDASFNTETALAVSWGRLDDTTWDFRLREGVFFHDGTEFDVEDVLYSFEQAQAETSGLSALISTIASIEKIDSHRLEITTKQLDPLLLNKLTYVFMAPDAYEDFDIPMGTGPYRVSGFKETTLILERFPDYWGALAYFEELRLRYLPDPEERSTALLSGEVQALANVPPQAVSALEAASIPVYDFPSLEVSFLMFNTRGIFFDPNLRAAVWYALDTDYAERLGGGYLQSTSQIAATGITGYINNFELREKDIEKAKAYRGAYAGEIEVSLDLPSGLEALGAAIKEDLSEVDIAVTLNILNPAPFEEKILSGTSDFYFFGWKHDLADSADFFESVVHTQENFYGEFNGIGYSNATMDESIESLRTLTDSTKRRKELERLTELLLQDHLVLALFESQVLYALRPELYYDFRLDGLILASEIIENVVE